MDATLWDRGKAAAVLVVGKVHVFRSAQDFKKRCVEILRRRTQHGVLDSTRLGFLATSSSLRQGYPTGGGPDGDGKRAVLTISVIW